MKDRFEKAIDEFNKYAKKFDLENEMIKRKYYHTFRVVDYANDIAQSENLNADDLYIAKVCALLHDIARFKQATEYGTYVDALSFDHGDMGYEILKLDNYIGNYVENDEEKQIILKAVKNHNKYSIENGLTDRELYFAKLVRDADKLDIIDKQKNEILDTDYTVPEEAINAMREKRAMYRENNKVSDITCLLEMICFCYDMNFKRSFEILSEKKILKKKLEVLKKYIKLEDYELIEKLINNRKNI